MGLKNHFLPPSPLLGGEREASAAEARNWIRLFFSFSRKWGVGVCGVCRVGVGEGSVGQRSGVCGTVFFCGEWREGKIRPGPMLTSKEGEQCYMGVNGISCLLSLSPSKQEQS